EPDDRSGHRPGGHRAGADVLRRDRRDARHRAGREPLLRRGGHRPGAGSDVPARGPCRRVRRPPARNVPRPVLGWPHDVLPGARAPAAADAPRAVRGGHRGRRALAHPLPGRPRRGGADARAGREVLGLRHLRRAVHAQHRGL
ncbi:MAG: Hemoglobin-like protein HbO, partial [uncultured Nocardioidaceae bacterium]